MVVTRNEALLSLPEMAKVAKPIEFGESTPLWTDDFNNLVRALE